MLRNPARWLRVVIGALVLATCGEANPPMNAPLLAGFNAAPAPVAAQADDVYIGVAFSGGGHRATAFAFGVLEELRSVVAEDPEHGLAGRVRFVAGVSGGAVIGTWFALHGPDGLAGFRERYLLSDAERYMLPNGLDPETLARGLGQGLNTRDTFARALDETLFRGARFAALDGATAVNLRIVASDVASAAPFVFDSTTFDALCSDLSRLPLSEAVAASAAFPVIFSPFVIEAHRRSCDFTLPPALAVARDNRQAHPALRLLAETIARYADPTEIRSVRLLDGGMTDSYGTTGFLAARADGGLAPMTPVEAVRVRRILFLAVDAAHDNWRITDSLLPSGRLLGLTLYGLSQRLSDNGGGDLDPLLAGRAITATTTGSYATLSAAMVLWRQEIVAWRCGLDAEQLDSLYPDRPEDWDCRDLHVHVDEIGLERLPLALRDRMNDVPTRLVLSADEVDIAIAAGRIALRRAPAYVGFLQGIGVAD